MRRKLAMAGLLMVILVSGCTNPSQQPTPGPNNGEASSTDSTNQSLLQFRKEASFPIFVPTEVPAGIVPQTPNARDRTVEIVYLSEDGSVGLRVTNGPAGCCLDSDPRKAVGATSIRDDITGYFIINQPEFGGPILWWQEAGTYIALSGPQLAKVDLVEIAASMSVTARPTFR